eukprot:7994545-Prorocentrum_lima.AAC.1
MGVDDTWKSDHCCVTAEVHITSAADRPKGRRRIDPRVLYQPETRKAVVELHTEVYKTHPPERTGGEGRTHDIFKRKLYTLLRRRT